MELGSVADFVSPIAECTLPHIKRHLRYPFKYQSNVEKLKNQVDKLTTARNDLLHSVDAEVRKGETILDAVQKWLSVAGKDIEEAQNFLDAQTEAKKSCFFGLIPNFWKRYQLSKEAEKEALAMDELQNDGKFDRISYHHPPPETPSVHGIDTLHSRVCVLNNVMNALKDPNINRIGVYGMGGVGKTTLAKEVRMKVLEDKLFNSAIMVIVSQAPDIRKIQGEIGDALGLEFHGESEGGRANQLRQRLIQEGKTLIILDDIWAQVELEAVGIPCGNDCKGCKILLTSRNEHVLSSEMDTHKNLKLEELSAEEAWRLFERMVGDEVRNPDLQSVATDVARKCAGLPILLVTVAKALKNKGLHVWKDALWQLSRVHNTEIKDKAYSALKLSYNHLPGSEVKSLFLVCGLLGNFDISVTDLLMYSVGLRLFKDINTIEGARNRLYTLLDRLKASCLLLDWKEDGYAKMHDVVRDVAVSIASEDQHVFTAKTGAVLKEWPVEDFLKSCTRISLPNCDVDNLPQRLECTELELLIFGSGSFYSSFNIPNLFFEGIAKLKVLHFTRMHSYKSLPHSFDVLKNIHTLCLHDCVVRDLAIIGELKKLEILSFRGSSIKQLPREIEQLTQLKLLDLSACSELNVIPANVISRLSLLQELYMDYSFEQWDVKGLNNESNASTAELGHLSHLTALELSIPKAHTLSKDLFSLKLERYRMFIGSTWQRGRWLQASSSRQLSLRLTTSIHLEERYKIFIATTEALHLDLGGVEGCKNVLYDLNKDGFPQLKHLIIENGYQIQYIINSSNQVPCTAFPILESLCLANMMTMEKICHSQLTSESFSKLRNLTVRSCNGLKYLFSFSIVGCLPQLREMKVINCANLEAIIAHESEEVSEVTVLGQLCSLTLRNVPQLKSFCFNVRLLSISQTKQRQLITNSAFQEIVSSEDQLSTSLSFFNGKVFFPSLENLRVDSIGCERIWHDQLSTMTPNLIDLEVNKCQNLKYLFTSSLVKSLTQLKKLFISQCEFMKGAIVTEDQIVEDERKNILFPKLESLELKDLSNLTSFCNTGSPIECCSLRKLVIRSCPALKTFVSDPPLSDMNSKSNHCTESQPFFDEKVAFPSLEEMEISDLKMKDMWHNLLAEGSFCKLKEMTINSCNQLQTVFPSNVLERFQKLENLTVHSCHSVEEIYQLQGGSVEESNSVASFELRKLCLSSLDELKRIWSMDSTGTSNFQYLHSVSVSRCGVVNNLFPSSIAKQLLQLEKLEINNCNELEVIIAKVDNGEADPSFEFPQLTSMKLSCLPEFTSFYPGTHGIQYPKLEVLEVVSCGKESIFALESFSFQEIHGEEQHITPNQQTSLAKKVFPNLETLVLDGRSMRILLPIAAVLFFNVKALEFIPLEGKFLVLFDFLQCLPSLDKLQVINSSHKFEIYESEDSTSLVPRITDFKLVFVNGLKHLTKQHFYPLDLQYLEILRIEDCDDLIDLSPSLSASFQRLTILEISLCAKLVKLATFSAAKNMVHLTTLTIRYCEKLKEIVAANADGTTEDDDDDEIITFSKLKTLELINLESLKGFCLGNYTFIFPSLEQVTVAECPKMTSFSATSVSTSKLERVQVEHFGRKWHWEGNLNSTIQHMYKNIEMVGLENVCELKLSTFSQLKEKWRNQQLPFNLFRGLNDLVVDKCAYFSNAIPSNLLWFLDSLETLVVKKCNSLEEVFDMEGLNAYEGDADLMPQFTELHLIDLPNLKHVLSMDPRGILSFKHLQLLKVHNCSSLTKIFTLSTATDLENLQSLEVQNCKLVEEIIAKEGEEETVWNDAIFPSLKSIILMSLPKLVNFYSGKGILKCPSLKRIDVVDCPKMEIFTFTFANEGELDAFFFNGKVVIPNLEEWRVEWNVAMKVICNQNFKHESLCKLNAIELVDFYGEWVHVPPIFFQRLPNLQKLVLGCEFLDDEEFPDKPNYSQEKQLGLDARMRMLNLYALPTLKQIVKEESLLLPIFQYLENLRVYECIGLKSLVPSSVSFINLTDLDVWKCDKLVNVITSSIARSLGQLKRMSIHECNMMQEIVASEGDRVGDEICFIQLEHMHLYHLPCLKSFCSGNFNFYFPSLTNVFIRECPKMENFAQGVLSTPKWNQGQQEWKGNLNNMIQMHFKEMVGFDGFESLKLSEFPQLKEKWHGQLPVHFLGNIIELVIDKCEIFSNAIPSKLLPFLSELETLIVENCDSLEEVFEVKGRYVYAWDAGLIPKIKELHLIDLPILRHALNKDSQGILSFKSLEFLKVHNCNNLTSIFTLSMAQDLVKLQFLEVKTCNLVKEIIRKEEEEETLGDNSIIFPSLESIILNSLEGLVNFYSGKNILKCPSLERIDVVYCPKVEIFAEGEIQILDSTIFNSKVAIPSLEECKVEWNVFMKKIFYENFQHELLCKLKVIEFIDFPGECLNFPSNFFQRLPNLQKLVLGDSCSESELLDEEYNDELSDEEEYNDELLDEKSTSEENHSGSLAQKLMLCLSKLPNLKHLVDEDDFQLVSVFENLEALTVFECSGLKSLLPSAIIFQNLETLEVFKCHGLISLMTSSTARNLVQLKQMRIIDCEMMEEIVTSKGDTLEDEICFIYLEYLELRCLPSLTSFSLSNYNFNFSTLENVVVIECPKMKIFGRGVLSTAKLERILANNEQKWECSLNNTIQMLFETMNGQNAQSN